MAEFAGPALISQRGFYLQAGEANFKEKATWADFIKVAVSGDLVGKIVEGPTGLGTSVSSEDVPVLGQDEADTFSNLPTKEQLTVTVQARHGNEKFKAVRDAAIGTVYTAAYAEHAADLAATGSFTGALFRAKLAGFSYDGSVGNTYARATITMDRQDKIQWLSAGD